MPKVLVLYYSSYGHIEKMAEAVAAGAREAGATGWMVKPFDPEKLIATVRKVAP